MVPHLSPLSNTQPYKITNDQPNYWANRPGLDMNTSNRGLARTWSTQSSHKVWYFTIWYCGLNYKAFLIKLIIINHHNTTLIYSSQVANRLWLMVRYFKPWQCLDFDPQSCHKVWYHTYHLGLTPSHTRSQMINLTTRLIDLGSI